MLAVRRYCLGIPLLVLFAVGCDPSLPVELADPASFAAAAGASSSLNATAVSPSQIDLVWQDNSSNETGFEVHRSTDGASGTFTLRATTGAGVTSYSDAGLTPLTQYCYKVRSFRKTGAKTQYSEFSATACATTPAPPVPAAPSEASATPASSNAVSVRWIDNASNEDGFRVERSIDGGATWTTAGTVGPGVTDSFDGGRASEQHVCYRVIAFNGGGNSLASNIDCTAPPAAPTGLTATAATDQPAIDLSWTDISAVEDGYEVWRDGPNYLSPVADLPANSTSYRDVAVGSNTIYGYYVRAKKDGGFSDLSDAASAECLHADCPPICSGNLDCGGGYICDLVDGLCVPHCNDGVQNGGESDVDCGGDWCDARCAIGQTCSVNGDCASGICGPPGICQAPAGQP